MGAPDTTIEDLAAKIDPIQEKVADEVTTPVQEATAEVAAEVIEVAVTKEKAE